MTITSTCTSFAGDFNGRGHGHAPVLYQAQQPMRCSQHFNLSHWTPQLVRYLLRIAPATARVPYKQATQMHLTCWRFRWPWQCTSTVPSALTYASYSALRFKPLDTATGWVFALYCPADRQGPIQTSSHLTQGGEVCGYNRDESVSI